MANVILENQAKSGRKSKSMRTRAMPHRLAGPISELGSSRAFAVCSQTISVTPALSAILKAMTQTGRVNFIEG